MTTPRHEAPTTGPRPWTLAIETSNPSAIDDTGPGDPAARPGVAAADHPGADPLDAEPLRPTGRHDDDLMPAIARLTARLELDPSALQAIAVCIGPGGYTGLRLAVVTAKMLALATGARPIPVQAAAVAALGLADDPALVLLASKRAAAWAALASASGPIEPLGVLDAGAMDRVLRDRGVRTVIADRHLPPELRAVAERAGCDVRPPELGPGRCVRAAEARDAVDPDALTPLYAREPEAVRVWNARRDGVRDPGLGP